MGFLRNLKEQFSPTPVAMADLRPDLQACVRRLHESDQEKFLSWCGGYGAPLGSVDAQERYEAVLPTVGSGESGYAGPDGRGILVLTSLRLMFMGDLTRFEIPMQQLGMSNCGLEERYANATFRVAASVSNAPVYGFGFSTSHRESRDQFLERFEAVVRSSETQRSGASLSAADEIAKFAALRDQGIIAEEEFRAKKDELLGAATLPPESPASPSAAVAAVYDVHLLSAGRKPINVIKVIRKHWKMDLKRAKTMVDSAPVLLVTTDSRAEADTVRRELEAVGAIVEVEAR